MSESSSQHKPCNWALTNAFLPDGINSHQLTQEGSWRTLLVFTGAHWWGRLCWPRMLNMRSAFLVLLWGQATSLTNLANIPASQGWGEARKTKLKRACEWLEEERIQYQFRANNSIRETYLVSLEHSACQMSSHDQVQGWFTWKSVESWMLGIQMKATWQQWWKIKLP